MALRPTHFDVIRMNRQCNVLHDCVLGQLLDVIRLRPPTKDHAPLLDGKARVNRRPRSSKAIRSAALAISAAVVAFSICIISETPFTAESRVVRTGQRASSVTVSATLAPWTTANWNVAAIS